MEAEKILLKEEEETKGRNKQEIDRLMKKNETRRKKMGKKRDKEDKLR